METFAIENPWLLASLFGVLGIIVGLFSMHFWQRRQAGGQSVDQLRAEMEEYREKVTDHFATTSELFKDMTEKYRDVYNHLAKSSQDLCEAPMTQDRLEFVEQDSLSEDKAEAVSEEPELTKTVSEKTEPTKTGPKKEGLKQQAPTVPDSTTPEPIKKSTPEILDDEATSRV